MTLGLQIYEFIVAGRGRRVGDGLLTHGVHEVHRMHLKFLPSCVSRPIAQVAVRGLAANYDEPLCSGKRDHYLSAIFCNSARRWSATNCRWDVACSISLEPAPPLQPTASKLNDRTVPFMLEPGLGINLCRGALSRCFHKQGPDSIKGRLEPAGITASYVGMHHPGLYRLRSGITALQYSGQI